MSDKTWYIIIGVVIGIYLIYQLLQRQYGTTTEYETGIIFDKDAEITNIDYKSSGTTTSNATILTTITFSDGFRYLSHDFDMDRHFGGARIYIGEETLARIKKFAISEHRREYEKQQEKFAKRRGEKV